MLTLWEHLIENHRNPILDCSETQICSFTKINVNTSSSVSEHSCEMISKLLKRRKTYFEFSTKNLIQRKVNKEFKLSVDLQRATFSWRSIKGLSC